MPRIARGTEWFRDAARPSRARFTTARRRRRPRRRPLCRKRRSPPPPPLSSASRLVTTKAGLEPYGPPNAQRAAYGIPSNETGAVGETDRYSGQLQLVGGRARSGTCPRTSRPFTSPTTEGASIDHLRTVGYSGQVGGDNFGEATLDELRERPRAGGRDARSQHQHRREHGGNHGLRPGAARIQLPAANAGCEGRARCRCRRWCPCPWILSYDSCELLCTELAGDPRNDFSYLDCTDYMATQRQVCMFLVGRGARGPPNARVSDEFMKATRAA